ncbi:ATP-binding protein [Streptomyces sp. NPDC058664]|uniref:ATP-binding protein n=1 Tax=unclassified Streptomyces TaxID=2593676 RepID=UPI0036606CD0
MPEGNRRRAPADAAQAREEPGSAGSYVPRDAAEARARVARALETAVAGTGGRPSPTAVGDALLVTSELVSNALRHGGGLTGFDVESDGDAVTITVADASDELPHPADGRGRKRDAGPRGPGEGGFGWPLIGLLASEIRIRRLPGGGKAIEVRLPLH